MLEAVFGCHAFDSSSRSCKFSYCCRPIPHLASVGPVAPIGVGGRKCTGNDGVKHATCGCLGGWESICSCKRSKRTLRKSRKRLRQVVVEFDPLHLLRSTWLVRTLGAGHEDGAELGIEAFGRLRR